MRLIADYLWGIITVWHEAQGEPYEGKVAVAEVIWRRTKRKYLSDGTVAGTCLWPVQFSGWNAHDASPKYRERIEGAKLDSADPVVNDCVRAWEEARNSNLVPGVMHYYNDSLCDPEWARGAKVVAEIGNHRFIIPKEGK
jgi:spore germination cell wall hydrolase CwlJ-like protein